MPPVEPVSISKFREYLQINTEQPNPDYYKCRDFLFAYAKELGFQPWEHECVAGKPIVGMTFAGSVPQLPSLLLYSHTDVVPTFPEHWTNPPYSAHKDNNGNIYARGAQDMKCVGVQYMEALRQVLAANEPKPFLRTVHIVWGPDEEIGGHDGMEKFVQTDEFRSLNIGFALDEGLASENDTYRVFYGERCVWWFRIICPGGAILTIFNFDYQSNQAPGHGSRFIEDTAGPKLTSILNSVNEFREHQRKMLLSNPQLNLGDVTSVNVTRVEGGVQTNVIPSQFVVCEKDKSQLGYNIIHSDIDMRITPTEELKDREAMIAEWCKKAGPDVRYEFEQKGTCKTLTPTDLFDPWWCALAAVFEQEKCKISKEIFIGGTDARYLRGLGLPAIGFSPMINTPILLHDHNEFLNEAVFLEGVRLYTKILPALANLAK